MLLIISKNLYIFFQPFIRRGMYGPENLFLGTIYNMLICAFCGYMEERRNNPSLSPFWREVYRQEAIEQAHSSYLLWLQLVPPPPQRMPTEWTIYATKSHFSIVDSRYLEWMLPCTLPECYQLCWRNRQRQGRIYPWVSMAQAHGTLWRFLKYKNPEILRNVNWGMWLFYPCYKV